MGNNLSSRKNVVGKKSIEKIQLDHDRRSLKHLMKSNIRKTTVELKASESKSTRTMRRELKGLGLNNCVALRKPLISEANRKKRLQFVCGLISLGLPCSRVTGTSG